MRKVLTIAGSDCSGGAGIQADIKTICAHKMYGMSVITALTAQNTMGVTAIHNVEKEFISEQMKSVFEDIAPDAVKIGMVSEISTIEAIKEGLIKYNPKNIVLDTVMVSTSGHALLNENARQALVSMLIPLADIITPNIAEAEVLAGMKIENKESMEKAAKIISNLTDAVILIKGGHFEECADDLLYNHGKTTWYQQKRIDNENTHGTGCTLSSAIACALADGLTMEESVMSAKRYVTGAIEYGLNLGYGHGPLNHMHQYM